MATAVVDNCLLVEFYFSGPGQRNDYISIPNVAGMNLIFCRFVYFLLGFGILLSSFLLVSVTIDRYISIAFPLKVKSWNLLRTSQISMLVYIVISFTWSAAYVNVIRIIQYKDLSLCTHGKRFKDILATVTSAAVTNILCSTLILLFTILIPLSLSKMRKKRRNLNYANNSQRNEYKIEFMVFIVAALYILLRFPMVIIVNWITYYPTSIKKNDQIYMKLLLASSICSILMAFNHSVNFVIYIIFLRSFRETSCKMILCKTNTGQGQNVSAAKLRDYQNQTSTNKTRMDELKVTQPIDRGIQIFTPIIHILRPQTLSGPQTPQHMATRTQLR